MTTRGCRCIISPHGRQATARANSALWANLPSVGPFAVVNPEGQGRTLEHESWGDRGQIADLASMPRFVTAALPWLRLDRDRIYAFGESMGGQEVLLLAADYPRLLAGAAAFDAPTDLAKRYPRLSFAAHWHSVAPLDASRGGWHADAGPSSLCGPKPAQFRAPTCVLGSAARAVVEPR